jgi:hypothetical protein
MPEAAACTPRRQTLKGWCALAALLGVFILLESLLPLSTAVQIGADEGIELAKAMLCLQGHRLYSEIWNDQPPLHTFLVTQALRHLGHSVLWPRLITVGFALALLGAVFVIVLRHSGLGVAAICIGLVIASPGFIELSASCMLEIPALGTAVAALAVLSIPPRGRWFIREVVAGILLAAAAQMKLVPLYLVPLCALIVWLRNSKGGTGLKSAIVPLLVLGTSLIAAYVTLDLLIDRGAFLSNFQQTWTSHFGEAKSFDYGSADEHPFGWNVLLRNWDTSAPAMLGVLLLAFLVQRTPTVLVPLAWLALSFLVFAIHKPWWPYYYIHTAVPLCWCAALGIWKLVDGVRASRRRYGYVLLALYVFCAVPWMATRVYLQVSGIRKSPHTYSTLVLSQIERYRPFAHWIYADKPIYSFYSGIPLPPQLAVLVTKRFWAGEMTNARLVEELTSCKPELIVRDNDGREVPFEALLQTEYRLVYEDGADRLYAHRSVAKKALP